MAVIIIDENSEIGKELMKIIRSFEEKGGDSIQICNEPKLEDLFSACNTLYEPMADYQTKTADDIPFERIPGLPYTHKERMASLRRAEEQRRQGLSITDEEFEEEMKTW